eukprot:5084953-Amphidinium_carterae.1
MQHAALMLLMQSCVLERWTCIARVGVAVVPPSGLTGRFCKVRLSTTRDKMITADFFLSEPNERICDRYRLLLLRVEFR